MQRHGGRAVGAGPHLERRPALGYYDHMRYCCHCGQALDKDMGVFRATTCPSCGKDLRVCLNCRFYSPGEHWDCRETIEEAVRDKDRANFCSYFSYIEKAAGAGAADPATNAGAGGLQRGSQSSQAREAFDKLFGDG